MSAILSADDLNDFISPGVACIKPVETLPLQKPQDSVNPYEVTTEDKLPAANHPPAQISLTDCLACSGCVTSAEAVLVSLQSHAEVLNALDGCPSISPSQLRGDVTTDLMNGYGENSGDNKVFVASVSPQVRASLAATYGVKEQEAGWMIEQLLNGPLGLSSGGRFGNGFTWVVDTNTMREACLVIGAEEMMDSASRPGESAATDGEGAASTKPKTPILTSACPGWICYAEKTHPHILPHLSRLKSPQALTGILLKTVLSKELGISPDRIWHVALMPCFDKKLEASRAELTDVYWQSGQESKLAVRDVDCVITARELLMLADTRGISFPNLPRAPLDLQHRIPFPDPKLDAFLFPQHQLDRRRTPRNAPSTAGPSGGYLYHILQTYKTSHPGSEIRTERGRNADVVEYTLVRDDQVLLKGARYYGFRNIQNLVRKLKPPRKSRMPGGKTIMLGGSRKPGQPKGAAAAASQSASSEYAYVEVMACPGGCTNGGGQIKVDDLATVQAVNPGTGNEKPGPAEQKLWLAKVDEAYFSAESDDEPMPDADDHSMQVDAGGCEEPKSEIINGISTSHVKAILAHWSESTGIELDKLVYTSYRKVDSDVGKDEVGDTERVVELAGKIGGGW
ncbi:MAG: Cytosolic Fe-S cluster assembly factor nar1 [Pleopsidium flavum]|nr:MAG: Cytosolic Fe-S cluster assembly factor nar1 [Pleopsidium flavum]